MFFYYLELSIYLSFEVFFFYFLVLDFFSFKQDLLLFSNWLIYWSNLSGSTLIQSIYLLLKQFYQIMLFLTLFLWFFNLKNSNFFFVNY